MPSIADELPALDDALDSLHEASRRSAKQRNTKVSDVVDTICRHALAGGLDHDAIRDVIQLASVKTHLDQTSITTLIKNLYPAQRVPADVVVTIVGALGQGKGKPSPGTQDSLVKWLTTVHEILEDASILSRLYSVLFGMLDMISIRTSLCHLLSLITRRKHVKPFRIQELLELSRGIGNEPALQGLLRVYKDYYPDIILGSTSTSRKSFAPQPDAEWRTRIFAIQDATVALEDATNGVHNGFKVLRKGPKRGKVSIIPEVHTFHATETSVTLEGIDNVSSLVERLDRIEPPGQMISLLTDPLLQKYADLKPSPLMETRIDLWLAICLEDLYENQCKDIGDSYFLSDILDGLHKHAQYTKRIHPAVQSFLRVYLPIWDGKSDVESIFGLLSYISIDSFHDGHTTYFAHAERAIATQDPSAYFRIVDLYTAVLEHQTTAIKTADASIVRSILEDLAAHVATLSQSLILSTSETSTRAILSSILSFYEVLSASNIPRIIPIILPPTHLVYLLAQEPSSQTFSRMCGILATYKIAFDKHPKPVKDYYPASTTDTFNICLRDIYNLIWVARGFTVAPQKSIGLFCDPALRGILSDYLHSMHRGYDIANALGLSNNPLLTACAASAWRALEKREIDKGKHDSESAAYHQGPVSQLSLEALKRKGGVSVEWDGPEGYKVFVLQWLAERGLGGIRDLMFATVTNLKRKV